MAFTAADVKKLREMTNVGMMDCKKALTASDGDMDKAVEWLREKGLAAAAKKSGRIAAEGAVSAAVANGVGAIVEVNCETDFAAGSDKFKEFLADVTKVILENKPETLEGLMACKYVDSDKTVEETIPDKVLVIGENIKIRRFATYTTGVTVPYIHMGGRIGVLFAKPQIDRRLVIACLYQVLLREGSFSPLALRTLSAFPREMLCAMTLQSIL